MEEAEEDLVDKDQVEDSADILGQGLHLVEQGADSVVTQVVAAEAVTVVEEPSRSRYVPISLDLVAARKEISATCITLNPVVAVVVEVWAIKVDQVVAKAYLRRFQVEVDRQASNNKDLQVLTNISSSSTLSNTYQEFANMEKIANLRIHASTHTQRINSHRVSHLGRLRPRQFATT